MDTSKLKKEIFKIQLPLEGTMEPMALIYNSDRSREFYLPLTKQLTDMMKGRPKTFFFAKDDGLGQVEFLEEAPWQNW